jgi:hypothetical protein
MDQNALRVSDADRDAVITELGQHFQAGRLDPAELDDRTGRALQARVRGDLDVLLADLPREQRVPAGSPVTTPPRRMLAPFLVPVLVAAALTTAVLVAGGPSGWHDRWAAGWALWWVIPLMALRMMWWRRIGRTRPWR